MCSDIECCSLLRELHSTVEVNLIIVNVFEIDQMNKVSIDECIGLLVHWIERV